MWMGIHGLYGQTPNFQTKHIENLLATDSLTAAKNQIQKAIAYYQSVKNYDSLVRYIPAKPIDCPSPTAHRIHRS
jgi:hypothetical protein